MLLLCLKIFFARIVDVSIATFRTMVMVRGKKAIPTILAFIEVIIWFYTVRVALQTNISSIWIPISYALGYAMGSLIGSYFSERLVKGTCSVKIITRKNNKKLINAIKKEGYGITIIELKKEKEKQNKELLYVELNSCNAKKLEELVNVYDKKAFIVVCNSHFVVGGLIK